MQVTDKFTRMTNYRYSLTIRSVVDLGLWASQVNERFVKALNLEVPTKICETMHREGTSRMLVEFACEDINRKGVWVEHVFCYCEDNACVAHAIVRAIRRPGKNTDPDWEKEYKLFDVVPSNPVDLRLDELVRRIEDTKIQHASDIRMLQGEIEKLTLQLKSFSEFKDRVDTWAQSEGVNFNTSRTTNVLQSRRSSNYPKTNY